MEWYSKYLQVYEKPFAEAPQAVIEEVRRNLAGLQSNEPLVTVSLIGYNEEKHLLACLWSLSEMKCKYPVEIIGQRIERSHCGDLRGLRCALFHGNAT